MADTTAQALRSAENELQRLRGLLDITVRFIHDTAHDADARTALAARLGLPGPRQTLTVPATAPKEAARGH